MAQLLLDFAARAVKKQQGIKAELTAHLESIGFVKSRYWSDSIDYNLIEPASHRKTFLFIRSDDTHLWATALVYYGQFQHERTYMFGGSQMEEYQKCDAATSGPLENIESLAAFLGVLKQIGF